MRVADYIFKTLADKGIDTVFLVTGGGAMHLDDAIRNEKKLKYVCCLHEQACAMAAEGYARIRNMPGLVCVTTGPGGTNAITGVTGAWLDSIPMIVISGQVKRETLMETYPGLKVRQLGDQELNIIDLVKPITKYAVCVTDPGKICCELEKAWELAVSGRPGPVWLDIPLDVQASAMPDSFPQITDCREPLPAPSADDIGSLLEKLRSAERPAIIAGNGIRLAGAVENFRKLTEKLPVPFLTAISGIDLIDSSFERFFGRPGIIGERCGNFVLQNADLLLILGTRMGIRMTGYDFESVARNAFKIMVDIDPNEMKRPLFHPDLALCSDAGLLIEALLSGLDKSPVSPKQSWLDRCAEWKRKYPVVTDHHRSRTDYVSSYRFPELLSANLPSGSIVVTGNGTAYTSTYQSIPVHDGMRVFANQGCASMGYGLPASIGAALAAPDKLTVCITGDGSLQMNLQELQTLRSLKLDLKLFVYNNDGYLSIKNTQNSFFGGNHIGSDPGSGLSLPDLCRVAEAFGLKTYRLRNNAEAEALLPEILHSEGPVFCEVMTDPLEILGPKAASSRMPDGTMRSCPLEDLFPFLSREELQSNMLP